MDRDVLIPGIMLFVGGALLIGLSVWSFSNVIDTAQHPTVVIKVCEQDIQSLAVFPGDRTRMPDKKVNHD